MPFKARHLMLLLCFMPGVVCARSVQLKWRSVPNAVAYELQIRQGKRVVFGKVLEQKETRWKGKLGPGYYTYRLRAIDRVERPGEWSDDKVILVKPPTPQPELPKDGAKFLFTCLPQMATMRWSVEEPGGKFRLEVQRDGFPLYTEQLSPGTTEAPLKEIESGDYRWRVTAFVEAKGAIPNGLKNREGSIAKSKPSPWRTFNLQLDAAYLDAAKRFHAPALVWPVETIKPPADGRLKLQWRNVEGAEAYEVTLQEITSDDREPAAEAPIKKMTTTELSAVVDVAPTKRYRWRVRGLAHLDPATQNATVTGPSSSAEFALDPNASDLPPWLALSGQVGVRLGIAPYSLSLSSPELANNGPVHGTTLATGVDAITRFSDHWGAALSLSGSYYSFSGSPTFQKDIVAGAVYRFELTHEAYPFLMEVRAGIGIRDFFNLAPTLSNGVATGTTVTSFTTIGPFAGLGIEKALSPRVALALRGMFLLPEGFLSNPAGTSFNSAKNANNTTLSLGAAYRWDSRFGLGFDLTDESRGLSYSVGSAPGLQQINLGVYRIGVSFLYWWK